MYKTISRPMFEIFLAAGALEISEVEFGKCQFMQASVGYSETSCVAVQVRPTRYSPARVQEHNFTAL